MCTVLFPYKYFCSPTKQLLFPYKMTVPFDLFPYKTILLFPYKKQANCFSKSKKVGKLLDHYKYLLVFTYIFTYDCSPTNVRNIRAAFRA